MGIFHILQDKINKTPQVKLAVVGTTGSGKTYLLTDLVGALEKLGYSRDDSFDDNTLHRDVYNLTEDRQDTGGMGKTPVYACRLENLYVSHFRDPNGQRMRIEFADIPGEAMTPESINMSRAIMKAMMACKSKIFTATKWKNPNTKKAVKVLDVDNDSLAKGSNMLTGLDGGIRSGSAAAVASAAARNNYVSTEARKAYYTQMGFVYGKQEKVDGAEVMEAFLEYDTDSVVNAIIKAWNLLKVDSVLTKKMLTYGSGKQVFQNVYKNHFFFHYYTMYATDVVVCDKCCTPLLGDSTDTLADSFTPMMQELRDLTSYKDAPEKNWYLALKGFDAVMREKPFAEVYDMSNGDINLVYSHFLALFRQACIHHVMDGGNENYKTPFSNNDRMMEWLTSDTQHDDTLSEMLENHYTSLGEDWKSLFADKSEYVVAGQQDLALLVKKRLKDFCMADERIAKSAEAGDDEQTLLQMPQHVYLVATPIDDEFHVCRHSSDDPTSFEGNAQHYNQRANFGSLQLATGILLEHNLDINDKYNNYGIVLNYIHGTEM